MIKEIISYGGNTFSPDYEVNFVKGSEPRFPDVNISMLERIGASPVISTLQRQPRTMALMIRIVGDDRNALRSQLFNWFDPDDEDIKVLVGEDHDETSLYVEAMCEDLRVYGDQQHDTVFVATIKLSDDVRWRSVTEEDDTWAITASGQERTIANDGEDDTYPTFTIEPTSAKSEGYDRKRYCLVAWRADDGFTEYPVCLEGIDTAALVAANKMLASGWDLRVFVDGKQQERKIINMNTDDTDVWLYLDFQAAPELEIETSIASSGSITSISLDDADEMELLPSTGVVMIGSEAFQYTSRDIYTKRLTGITRGVWGTSEAAHTAGDDVHWLQHEVVLIYGYSDASEPTTYRWLEGLYDPAFDLEDSSNTLWVYTTFTNAFPHWKDRPLAWGEQGSVGLIGKGGLYTQTEWTFGTPWNVLGAWIIAQHSEAYGWVLGNPCGIVNAKWTNGKKHQPSGDPAWSARVMYYPKGGSWWKTQYTIEEPTVENTWESWSKDYDAADWDPAANWLAMATYFYRSMIEAGGVEVRLDSDGVPDVTVGSEITNYTLDLELSNETTGESLEVSIEMELNEELEIDTKNKVVTYSKDGSMQFQSVRPDTIRKHWLKLQPGNNVLKYTDANTQGVTVVTEFHERYY